MDLKPNDSTIYSLRVCAGDKPMHIGTEVVVDALNNLLDDVRLVSTSYKYRSGRSKGDRGTFYVEQVLYCPAMQCQYTLRIDIIEDKPEWAIPVGKMYLYKFDNLDRDNE